MKLFSKHPKLKDSVNVLLFCTQTPDHWIPSNACILHGRLGLSDAVSAFDLNMSCSGYIYGLEIARNYILSGSAENVLLITADTYSKYIHPNDRATRVLFGDGAAVTWITKSDTSAGIIDVQCGTQGKDFDAGIVPAGGCRMPFNSETSVEFEDRSGNIKTKQNLHLDGIRIFLFTKSKVPGLVKDMLSRNSMSVGDIDKYVFHQASLSILQSIAKFIGLDQHQTINTLEKIGNTVSSSIPITLAIGFESEQIKKNDKIILAGYGAGLSWGVALINV